MGCGLSKEEKENKTINLNIDKQLKEDGRKMRDEVKMLLLGKSHKSLLEMNMKFN